MNDSQLLLDVTATLMRIELTATGQNPAITTPDEQLSTIARWAQEQRERIGIEYTRRVNELEVTSGHN